MEMIGGTEVRWESGQRVGIAWRTPVHGHGEWRMVNGGSRLLGEGYLDRQVDVVSVERSGWRTSSPSPGRGGRAGTGGDRREDKPDARQGWRLTRSCLEVG